MTDTPATAKPAAARPPRLRPAIMTLTPAAVARLKDLMATRGEQTAALRIGVKKGGCAGMEYAMSWTDHVEPFDEVIEVDGARVVVDRQAVMFLLGTAMDYRTDTLSARFEFNNPNQKSACGCGESIALVPASQDALAAIDR